MNGAQTLFNLAQEAMERAYAPYSGFKVGAAVLSSGGNFYSGCNVENVSYPCGTCAEAGAIASMIRGGDSKITEILILADSRDLIMPCGACLQRIKEFALPGTQIHLAGKNGIQKTCLLQDLLPHAFTAGELSHD